MSRSLERRRAKARSFLPLGPTDEAVDDWVRHEMTKGLTEREALALSAAYSGSLHATEPTKGFKNLIDLDLIRLSHDWWILTERGERLLKIRRWRAEGLNERQIQGRLNPREIQIAAIQSIGLSDEQISAALGETV